MTFQKIKYYFFIFVTLFCSTLAFGQQNPIDSLKLLLKTTLHDTTRCNVLNELAETASDEEWPLFNEQLLKLTEQCAGTATNKVLKEFYLSYLANAFNNVGYIAQQEGNIPKALESYYSCLKIQEKINDKKEMTSTLNNIATIYDHQGDIPKALEFHFKSLKMREELKDKKGIAQSLNNLGGIYNTQGDTQKSLEFHQKSLKIREEIKDNKGIAVSLNNLGTLYNKMGYAPKALEFFNKSLKIREALKDRLGIAHSMINIGAIYYHLNDSLKALEFFHKSLKITEEIKDKNGMTYSLNYIGTILFYQGKLGEAVPYAKRAMQTAKELGYPEIIKVAAALLKMIYKKQNKHKEAFEMYELETQMYDSINNVENRQASIKTELQYAYETKAAVANAEHKSELEKQQAVADEKNLKQTIIIWSVAFGLLLVIVFAAFVFKSLNTTRKQKQLIEIKNKETEEQKKIIEEKQKEVLDSIYYAKRIQTSLMPTDKYIAKILRNKRA